MIENRNAPIFVVTPERLGTHEKIIAVPTTSRIAAEMTPVR